VHREKRDITPESCEKRFRPVLDNISDAVYVLDTEGKFVFINRAMAERSGTRREDFLGRHFLDFLGPKDRKSARIRFQKVIAGESVPPYEVEYKAANGRCIWVEVNSKAVYENGRIVGSIGISRDMRRRQKEKEELEQIVKERTERLEEELRERERAEDALKKSERKFRELAELLPVVVFETDQEGMLTYTNHAGFQTFGYSQERLARGMSAYEIFAEGDRARLKRNITRLMKGRNLGLGQYICLRENGSTFPAFVHSNAILEDDGNRAGLRGVLVDISAQKQAEEEIMSYQKHLNTLASELSLAEERVRRHTATELHDTVAQILAFATMKLGVLRRSIYEDSLKSKVDEVSTLIGEATASTRGIMSELVSPILYEMGLVPAIEWMAQRFKQNHDLDVEVTDGDEPGHLSFDVKVLLFQIVRELLLNVVKHADAKKAVVKIDTDKRCFRIQVEDDGRGIEPGRIFANPPDAMTHFGLFSIKVRLESIGGKFWIGPGSGRGTKSIFSVPFSSEAGNREGARDDHQDLDRG